MTIATMMAAVWLLAQAPAAGAQASEVRVAPRATDWVVVVAAPVYLPDGGVRMETTSLPSSGVGLVHLFSRKTICTPGTTGATEPADAAFGWRVASHVLSRSDTEVVVSLDWRRLWDAGKKSNNGPAGTVQLTLHPGDRIPLDHISNGSPTADCHAVGMGLEIKLARTAPATPPPPASALPIGATPGGAKPIDAELWLTHTSPAGAEQVLHQIVPLQEAGGRFSFPAETVATASGDLNVELTGTIDRFRSPAAGEYLVLMMNRLVTGDGLPSAGITGKTSAVVPLPGAGEVFSFELGGAAGRARIGGGGGAGGGGRGGMTAAAAGGGPGSAQNPAQARRGGAGTVSEVPSGRGGGGAASNVAQLAAMLEGHRFALTITVK